jgi:hypothetical protein
MHFDQIIGETPSFEPSPAKLHRRYGEGRRRRLSRKNRVIDRDEEGLRRTEADMKSNLPLRVDQNTTLVDVKYERTHSTYWYVIDKPDQFDPQETARQVQIGVCTNAENSSTMKKEGFSYEYHYRTKDGLALTDFKVTTCD